MKHPTLSSFLLLLSGLAAVLLSVFPPALAQEPGEVVLYQENFDYAQGWDLEPGWQVVQDGDNWVLTGEGHHWARPDVQFGGDFRVQFRLKLVRGDIHLVYRLNQTGRYFIGFHERGSHLSKQYWPDTFVDGLAGSEVVHPLETWHEVEIAGHGATLRLLVDGAVEWEYTDPEPLLSGSFAFETLDDSVAYVDDIIVYGPAPTPTPTPDRRFTWVRTGGPLGGLGYDVRMRPDNPDVMYVTDAWAGVFMSTDGGQTWFPSNQGITTRAGESGDAIPVFCLTIDLHDYDTIWVGTQNVRGIFKSTDGGRTWVEMDNGVVEYEGITFRGFTVDPRSSDVVYAAAELSSWAWAGEERTGREFDLTQGVVYKTTDGGQNWTAVWRGDNLARYIWIDPRDPDVLYVSTGIFDREAANSDPVKGLPGGEGVLKSTDGGQTWTRANTGLNNLYVGTLFMHPENPDILLAGTGNNQYYRGQGVYLSTDGGGTWQHVLRGDNINAVEFALSDPDIAYAGSANAVYRSEDGGHTWQLVSGGDENGWGPPGVRAGFPIDFQVDPRDPNRIFANEYGGGNFVSIDGGRTWAMASAGYTGAQVRDIAVDPTSGRVYAAARSGLFASDDGGNTWVGLNTPPAASMEWYVVAIDPTDAQHVLAANNWNGVILQSHDGGQKWRPVSRRPDGSMSWRAIAFAPSDPKTVYASTSAFYSAGTFDDRMPAGGVYVSHDGGTSWRAANDSTTQDANVTALAVDPRDPQTVYAATGNHGLLKTTDGGQTWTIINQGLPSDPSALSVTVHPIEPDVVFAGLAFGGLYRSTDGGTTWQPSGAGMNPEAMLSDAVFDPVDSEIMFAADRFSGVYRSTDSGLTWLPINTNLRTRDVNALAISSDGEHLYAATEGEGVYRLDLSGQAPASVATPPTPTFAAATPTSVTAAPTATPPPAEPTAQPTATPAPEPEPPAGRGICGGAAALPLALLGLVWLNRGKVQMNNLKRTIGLLLLLGLLLFALPSCGGKRGGMGTQIAGGPKTATEAQTPKVEPTATPLHPTPSETPAAEPPTPSPTPLAEPTWAECRQWLASSKELTVPFDCPASWSFFRDELFKRGGGVFPVGDDRYYLVLFPDDWETVTDRKIIISLHGTGGCAEWMLNHWYQTSSPAHSWVLVALQYYDRETKQYDGDEVIYQNLQTILEDLHAHCPIAGSDVFYHGFSRGSAQSFPVAIRDRAGRQAFSAFIADSGCAGLDHPTLRNAPDDALKGAHFWMWCGENDVSTVDPNRMTCGVMQTDMLPYVQNHGGVVDALIQEKGAAHGMFSGCPQENAKECTPRTAENLGPSLPLLFDYIESFP